MAQFPAMPLWTDAYLADTRHLSPQEHGAYLLLLMAMWRSPDGWLPGDDNFLARTIGMRSDHWARTKPTIMAFMHLEDGRITQGRLQRELAYVRESSRKQSDRARQRWDGQASLSRGAKSSPKGSTINEPNPLKNNGAGDAAAYAAAMPPHPHPHPHTDNESSVGTATPHLADSHAHARAKDGQAKEARKTKPNGSELDSAFAEFWNTCLRKIGKGDARKAFEQAIRSGKATPEEIIAGAKRYAERVRRERTEERFIKYPAAWIRAEQWTDEDFKQGLPDWREVL